MGHEQAPAVGIVGGGKVGTQLFHLFSGSQLTRVVYVVDRDRQAPGIVAARAASVPTFTDFRQAHGAVRADFVFEVTGSPNAVATARETVDGSPTQLVTHEMAYIILKVIEESRQRTTEQVLADTLGIREDIGESLQAISGTLSGINRATSEMHLLSINARIEAARAGEHGRGFDVVAQQVESSARSVRQMTDEIERLNVNMLSVSERIDAAVRRLS